MALRNILIIMVKEIKQNLRDKRALTLMILLPILLMAILGTALSGAFSSSITFDDMNILYTNQGGAQSVKMFNQFMEQGKKLNMSFTETENTDEGISGVKDVKYICYIRILNNGEILLYKNSRYTLDAGMVESVLTTFVQRYNAIAAIAKINPLSIKEMISNADKNVVTTSSLDAKRQPRSIDYYSVAMLTLIIMYAANTGAWAIKGEKTGKTGSRLLVAPIRKYEILIGKTLGSILATVLQVLVVILVSKYVLKGYWGTHMLPVLLIILTLIILTVAMGAGLAFIFKNETSMSSVISAIIPFMVFLGGGYVPLSQFNSSVLMQIAKISPLKWTNDAIFQIIYNNNFSQLGGAIAINLGIAAIFIIIASVLFRREAM